MKGLIKVIGVFSLLFMFASCTVHEHHYNGRKGLPPGQAKKVYGGSAKYYAPGQVKKRHYNDPGWDNDHKGKKHKKHKGHKHDRD